VTVDFTLMPVTEEPEERAYYLKHAFQSLRPPYFVVTSTLSKEIPRALKRDIAARERVLLNRYL
jgi:hypothetical protein